MQTMRVVPDASETVAKTLKVAVDSVRMPLAEALEKRSALLGGGAEDDEEEGEGEEAQ